MNNECSSQAAVDNAGRDVQHKETESLSSATNNAPYYVSQLTRKAAYLCALATRRKSPGQEGGPAAEGITSQSGLAFKVLPCMQCEMGQILDCKIPPFCSAMGQ